MATFRRPEGVQGAMIPASQIPCPNKIQQVIDAGRQERVWNKVVSGIKSDLSTTLSAPPPDPDNQQPTAEDVFDAFLLEHIQATRWSRYIVPGSASRVFDGSLFVYHNPCANFWNLYNLAKGLFSEIGIRLLKSGCVWEARIPIGTLTDKGFVDSGLAAVEKTLLRHTGNLDPTPDTSAKMVKPTVREIELERGMKRLNESVVAERAYCERWDVESKLPATASVIEPAPEPEPTTDNALGDRLTSLLKETDKFFPERHFEYPLLYEPTGRPVMAVANADNFLACQELMQNPTDPRAWHYACKTAARRSSHHSGSMDEVIKYIVLAARCLNHANRLESQAVC